MCKDEGLFCNKIQDVNINLNTGKIHYGLNDEEKQENKHLTDQQNDQYLKQLFDAVDQDKDGMILKKEATILMDQLQIDKEVYDNVLNNMSPAGMDFKTFSSIVGEPIKRILKVVYQDNGKQGLKLLYKLMGYDFTDLESKKQRELEEQEKKKEEKKGNVKKNVSRDRL